MTKFETKSRHETEGQNEQLQLRQFRSHNKIIRYTQRQQQQSHDDVSDWQPNSRTHLQISRIEKFYI